MHSPAWTKWARPGGERGDSGTRASSMWTQFGRKALCNYKQGSAMSLYPVGYVINSAVSADIISFILICPCTSRLVDSDTKRLVVGARVRRRASLPVKHEF